MASPSLQLWIYAELILKLKTDATQTLTLYLSNRPIIDDTNATRYLPLLKQVTNLGTKIGDYLPEDSTVTLTIDNAPHSLGHERRFIDLLDRYTVVNQPVVFYIAETAIDDLNVTADFARAWTGKVNRWSAQFEDTSTVQLTIATEQIGRRLVTRQIDSSAFPNAANDAFGKSLPLVFGSSVEVKPARIDTNTWAYATTLGTSANGYSVGGVQTYYAKDSTGIYRSIASAASTTAGVYAVVESSPFSFAGWKEFANKITVGNGAILTSARVRFSGSGSGTWAAGDGELHLNLYWPDSKGVPGERIASTSRKKSDYQTSFRGAAGTNFWVEFVFTDPVIIGKGRASSFFVSVVDAKAGTEGDAYLACNTPSSTYYTLDYVATTSKYVWKTSTGGSSIIVHDLFGVKFTDTTGVTAASSLDENGLGYAKIAASMAAAPSGFTNPSLDDLDLVVATNGLIDDGAGTITGSASAVIKGAKHAIDVIDRSWNGSSWTGGTIDFTRHTSTHSLIGANLPYLGRQLKGSTEGKTDLFGALELICRNSLSRLSLFNGATKQTSLYAWGNNQPTAAVITDDDLVVREVQGLGTETIVNALTMHYDRRVRDINITAAASQGGFNNYAGTVKWSNGSNALATKLTQTAASLYGTRLNREESYDMLGDSTSAENVTTGLLAIYSKPHLFATIDIPYFKFKALDILDVIELVTPELPDFFGTSPNAHNPTYNGAEVSLSQGYPWRRAQRYRAQIEGREIQFSRTALPALRLTVRILDNYPTDPT